MAVFDLSRELGSPDTDRRLAAAWDAFDLALRVADEIAWQEGSDPASALAAGIACAAGRDLLPLPTTGGPQRPQVLADGTLAPYVDLLEAVRTALDGEARRTEDPDAVVAFHNAADRATEAAECLRHVRGRWSVATVDDFVGTAVTRLSRVPACLPPDLDPATYRALLGGISAVLGTAREWITDATGRAQGVIPYQLSSSPAAAAVGEPLKLLDYARTRLAALSDPQAFRSMSSESGPRAVQNLADAARLLTLARDVARSHLGPDGEPLTTYGRLVHTLDAHLYVLGRMGEVAQQACLALRAIDHTIPPQVLGERWYLNTAAAHLQNASLLAREAARATSLDLGPLPAAAPPTSLCDEVGDRLAAVADTCDRLQQAVDRAAVRPNATDQPLCGSDLHRISRPLALAHMLAGRLLHTVASQPSRHDDDDDLARLAMSLRQAAQSWGKSAAAWTGITDLRSPQATQPTASPPAPPAPPAPPPSQGYRYQARTRTPVALPRVEPHPAVSEAETLALHVGRMLFTDSWHPRSPATANPREPQQILADANGVENLVRALGRIPTAAHVIAAHVPSLTQRMNPTLFTDDASRRPRDLPVQQRWFRATRPQTEALLDAYAAAGQASRSTAEALSRALPAPPPRAQLDAAIVKIIDAQTASSALTEGGPAAKKRRPAPAERLDAAYRLSPDQSVAPSRRTRPKPPPSPGM